MTSFDPAHRFRVCALLAQRRLQVAELELELGRTCTAHGPGACAPSLSAAAAEVERAADLLAGLSVTLRAEAERELEGPPGAPPSKGRSRRGQA